MGHTCPGQYQQWLRSQEVDRHLRAELETLEAELAHLQEQIQRLAQTAPQADNNIIRLLASSLHEQREQTKKQVLPPSTESPPDESPTKPSPLNYLVGAGYQILSQKICQQQPLSMMYHSQPSLPLRERSYQKTLL